MTRTHTELTYLRASIESASSVDLVIILFDMLINDLKGAVEALASGDVERRSKELKHGFLVLEQLEASLDMNSGADAASALARFYGALRSSIMDGHIKASTEVLSRQIELLFDVRGAWAEVARRNAAASPATAELASVTSAYETSDGPALAGTWSV